MAKKPKSLIDCIYCGLNKLSTDEHILQDALGGVDCIDTVCKECNDHLAVNDKTLAVLSVLSSFASHELGGVGPELWDVDRERGGLLYDARSIKGTFAPVRKPQIVFDGDQPIVCFDEDDAKMDTQELQDRFYPRLKSAYDFFVQFGAEARKADHKCRDMLKLKQVARIRNEYRLPPRVSCNKPIRDWNHKALMFDLSFLTEEDRDIALQKLATRDWTKRSTGFETQLGSEMPEAHIGFDVTAAMQAFAKVGFNMLAKYCGATPVNLHTFPDAVDWILGKKHFYRVGNTRKVGFVTPDGVARLQCPPKSHKFRLTHDPLEKMWHFYGSFFEGKAGMYVVFPGPNNETWRSMEIVAPYDREMLAPDYHPMHRPFPVRAVLDPRLMAPSLQIQTAELNITHTRVKTDHLGNIL